MYTVQINNIEVYSNDFTPRFNHGVITSDMGQLLRKIASRQRLTCNSLPSHSTRLSANARSSVHFQPDRPTNSLICSLFTVKWPEPPQHARQEFWIIEIKEFLVAWREDSNKYSNNTWERRPPRSARADVRHKDFV